VIFLWFLLTGVLENKDFNEDKSDSEVPRGTAGCVKQRGAAVDSMLLETDIRSRMVD
jgi:hypothetical protein